MKLCRLPRRLLLLLSAALPCPPAQAAIDELPLQLNLERDAQLRWDNVDATADYWQAGVAPRAKLWDGRHYVELAPGASSIIRLPAGEQLRVVADTGPLAPAALIFSRSKGDGLELVLKPQIGKPDGSLLLAGDADGPSLLHLRRPAAAVGALRVALFVSRQTPPDALVRYRRLLAPDAPAVEVQSGRLAAAEAYWLLAPGKPLQLPRQAQQRLAIDLRALVPRAESAREQHLEIILRTAQKSFNQLIDTNSEHEAPVWIDGKPGVVSRRERIYFDLPIQEASVEETLQLESSYPVLVRVVGYTADDYLLPGLNNPNPPVEASPTGQERQGAIQALTQADLAGRQGWRGNDLQKAALASLGVLEQQTREFAAYPEVTSTLRQFRNHATFYRNLLPRRTTPPGELHFAYFTPPQLRERGTVPQPLSAAEQHWAALQGAIPSGLFLAIGGQAAPPSAATPATDSAYALPERYAPSDLRVVIHAPGAPSGETIYLQIDEQAPQALLVSPPAAVPAASFTDTPGALALRLQGHRWPAPASTHSGLFVAATAASPAPHITAGVIELPLSPSAKRVRLWRENPGGAPLYAALQYRASKPYGLAESGWPAGVEGAPARRIIADLLAAPAAPAGQPTPPADEDSLAADPTAVSQLRSLSRLLDAARRATLANLPAAAHGAPDVPADGGAAAYARALAAPDPLAALEAAVSDSGLPESERYWLICELLLRLDEPHLALQRWRQQAGFATNAPQRALVRQRLDRYFQQQDNGSARIQLHAAAVAQGDVEAVIPLAQNLFDEGDADTALQVLLLADPDSRPPELVLAIAYANQWWQLFEKTLPTLADPLRRNYWQAYREQARGINPEALFAAADAEGQALAKHAQQAAALHQAAAGRSAADHLTAWSRWAFEHPGPRRWRDASTLISDTAGAVHVYQADRDLHQNAFRATTQAPLRLGFAGPRRLRIEARPLHPDGASAPLDGWLRIRSADGLWLEPISDNVPAEALQINTEPPSRAGRSVERELSFGPGWHEVAIDGEDLPLPLLLRVRQLDPWRPLAHLAAPTPNTPLRPPNASLPEPGNIPFGWCDNCSEIVADDQASSQRWRRFDLGAWLGPEALTRPRPAGLAAGQAPPPPDPARLLAGKDPAALLDLPPPDAATVRERSIALLWLAEKNPDLRERALAQSLAWANDWPAVPGLNAVVDRLARRSGWSLISAVSSSAGRRPLTVDGRGPEAPALRVRSALLPALAPHERRLGGEGRWVLALENPKASQLDISLLNEELMLPLGPPMAVQIQVDQAPARTVRLAVGDATNTLRLSIPQGRHNVSVGIAEPVANQFLRIGVLEGGQRNIEVSQRTYHVATAETPIEVKLAGPAWLRIDELKDGRTESSYRYLPEPWQDVRVGVAAGQSEALFRLFLRRYEPNRPTPQTRHVSLLPQALPLPEAVPDRPPSPPTVRLLDGLALDGQQDGTWTLSAAGVRRPQFDDQPAPLLLHDEFFELAASWRYFAADSQRYYRTDLIGRGRENGAPTLGVRGELSGPLSTSPIDFTLAGAAYLQRPDPAAAPAPLPAPFAASEAALAQRGEPGTEGAVELAAALQQPRPLSPRAWHLPRLSAFARWQSLDENTRTESRAAEQFFDDNLAGSGLIGRSDFLRRHALYGEEGLDKDIFSAYRADHPFGVRFSDTYYQRPWLDALWYAGAAVTSNADLRLWKPDHLSVRVGWRQMLGPLQLSAEYELFHYLRDKHRADSASLDTVRLGIFGEHWRSADQRGELGVELSYDLAREAGGVVLYWRLDFGNGRGFRDYRPGDLIFHELRERRQSGANNRIEPDDPR